MIPNDLHYGFPSAVYMLFLVLVLLILFWQLYLYRKSVMTRFPRSEVLIPRSQSIFWVKVAVLCIAWIMVVLAVMQPLANGHYPEGKSEFLAQKKAHDVILLVDASASMELKDTRTGVSRLDYGKEIADEIVGYLRGENVALHAFTSETTKLSPLTLDYLFVRLMIKDMVINEGDTVGTNFVEVLATMREQYFRKMNSKQKTLVIISDGGDTGLEQLSGQEKEKQIDAIASIVAHYPENQLRVITVGVGSKEGKKIPQYGIVSVLDEKFMEKLSQSGQGKYYFANDWTALELAEDIGKQIEKRGAPLEDYGTVTQGKEDLIYDSYFQYPLGAAIFFLGMVLFFPETWRRKKTS